MDEEKEKELIDLIAEIKKGIISAEKKYGFIAEVKELRDLVFLIHAEVESSLELILYFQLFKVANGNKVTNKAIDENLVPFIMALDITTIGTGFAKKLNQVKEIVNLPTKKNGLYQNIDALNTIRVEFAHPKEKKYIKYNEPEKRIEAYKVLKKVVSQLPELRRHVNYRK